MTNLTTLTEAAAIVATTDPATASSERLERAVASARLLQSEATKLLAGIHDVHGALERAECPTCRGLGKVAYNESIDVPCPDCGDAGRVLAGAMPFLGIREGEL